MSNGGAALFSHRMAKKPNGSTSSTDTPGEDFSLAIRSNSGRSTQSTSPVCSAAAAVAESGMNFHSTRSKFATLPPAQLDAFS